MILETILSATIVTSPKSETVVATEPPIFVIGNGIFDASFGCVAVDLKFGKAGEYSHYLWLTGKGYSRTPIEADPDANEFRVNEGFGIDRINMPSGIWHLKSGYPETMWFDVSADRKEVCGAGHNGYGKVFEANIMRWSKPGLGVRAGGVRKDFQHGGQFTLDNHIAGKAGPSEILDKRFYDNTIPDSTHFYLWKGKNVRYYKVPKGVGSFYQATQNFALFGSTVKSMSGFTKRLQFIMRLRDSKVYDISKRAKPGEIFVTVCGFWDTSELVYAVNIPNKKKSEFRRFRLPE